MLDPGSLAVQVGGWIVCGVIAVVMLAVVLVMLLRGGKPFDFKASGFGVKIELASKASQECDNHNDKEKSDAEEAQ